MDEIFVDCFKAIDWKTFAHGFVLNQKVLLSSI